MTDASKLIMQATKHLTQLKQTDESMKSKISLTTKELEQLIKLIMETAMAATKIKLKLQKDELKDTKVLLSEKPALFGFPIIEIV